MVQVGEVSWNVQGDIGGVGISRFWFANATLADIGAPDVAAAAAASHAFLASAAGNVPTPISWTINPQVNVYDASTGLVQPPWVVTSPPAAVVGSGGTNFAAGVGARVNWKTSVVEGRRLIRGCIFVAPLASVSFNSSGSVQPTFVSTMTTAATTYLNALTAAGTTGMVWHRPAKGTFSGGVLGPIRAGICSSVPASLRSRRN